MSSARPRPELLARITNSRRAADYLVVALLGTYACIPLALALQFPGLEHYFELAALAVVSAIFIYMGSKASWADGFIAGRFPRVAVDGDTFIGVVWALFVSFVLLAWLTAEQIPLLASISGADAETIAYLRERFLKAREGWQSPFVYVNAILTGALVPYTVAQMFIFRARLRWAAFAFFLVYCVSFVEKAYFMKAALPLLYLVAQRVIRVPLSAPKLAALMVAILVAVTVASGAGTADVTGDDAFFSAGYLPQGPLAHIVWRTVAIPLITAGDAVRVFYDEFNGQLLWGTTSSFFAALLGVPQVEFERLVFAAQWGQNETSTGSSNSVYITEAFVNFGWLGVAAFSMLIGWMLRVFARSRDEAFRSLWPVFFLGVYTSGLIGLMLSNGFVLLFSLALLVRFRPGVRTRLSHPGLPRGSSIIPSRSR